MEDKKYAEHQQGQERVYGLIKHTHIKQSQFKSSFEQIKM